MLRDERVRHLGAYEAGRDSDRGDAVAAEVARGGFGEVDEPRLRRPVGHVLGRVATLSRPAGDVDNPSAAMGPEVPDGAARQVGGGEQVHPQVRLPSLPPCFGIVLDAHSRADTGVVHEPMNAPDPAFGLGPKLIRRPWDREVRADRHRTAADLLA